MCWNTRLLAGVHDDVRLHEMVPVFTFSLWGGLLGYKLLNVKIFKHTYLLGIKVNGTQLQYQAQALIKYNVEKYGASK